MEASKGGTIFARFVRKNAAGTNDMCTIYDSTPLPACEESNEVALG